ncbi:MAG: glycosyltransferase [Taibaiella sp.]|nr:glycosyltransferase [Taibaiella sp.]
MLLFYIFLLCVIVQLDFGLLFLLRGGRKMQPVEEVDGDGVSVIICARNEAENLRQNLPIILEQRYAKFEVIVVNDGSTDDSMSVLTEYKGKYGKLIVLEVTDGGNGKKRLIAEAVAAAAHEKLLFTDADCKPATDQWIRLMTGQLNGAKEIVAGYGGYRKGSGVLNSFTRWETVHTWLQMCVMARGGAPYMAVGRNLACTKQAMRRAMNDPVWTALPQGDDDMLVRCTATRENYAIQDDPASFTVTTAKATWADWYAQKQRHLSTGKYYRLHVKLLLGAYGLSHAAGWLSFFLLLVTPAAGTVCWLWGARCTLLWLAQYRAARAVYEKDVLFLLPVFDIGWMMYNFALLPYIAWKNKTTWT